jgi:hypothetical protein
MFMSTMRGGCPVPSGSSLYGCTVRFLFHGTTISKEDNVFCCHWIWLFPKRMVDTKKKDRVVILDRLPNIHYYESAD